MANEATIAVAKLDALEDLIYRTVVRAINDSRATGPVGQLSEALALALGGASEPVEAPPVKRGYAKAAPAAPSADWLSNTEAAALLGVSEKAVYLLGKGGELVTRKKPDHKGRGHAPREYERASVEKRKAARAAAAR